jgi:hypothetical protein
MACYPSIETRVVQALQNTGRIVDSRVVPASQKARISTWGFWNYLGCLGVSFPCPVDKAWINLLFLIGGFGYLTSPPSRSAVAPIEGLVNCDLGQSNRSAVRVTNLIGSSLGGKSSLSFLEREDAFVSL